LTAVALNVLYKSENLCWFSTTGILNIVTRMTFPAMTADVYVTAILCRAAELRGNVRNLRAVSALEMFQRKEMKNKYRRERGNI